MPHPPGFSPYAPDSRAASRYDEQPGRPNTGSQSTSSTADEKKQLVQGDDGASMDALIADLQSEDGLAVTDEESAHEPGSAPTAPDELLQTNPRYGLTDGEVLARRKRYGWNKMKEEKENLIIKFFSYFIGPIQFVMEVRHPQCFQSLINYYSRPHVQAAAVLAAGLQDWVDFGVICGLLLLNATVGFFQEFQAGSIVDELKKTLALQAVALRNGKPVDIGAHEVVPGDILQIEEASDLPTLSPHTH